MKKLPQGGAWCLWLVARGLSSIRVAVCRPSPLQGSPQASSRKARPGEAPPGWRWWVHAAAPRPFSLQSGARTARPWHSQTPAQRRTSSTSPPARWRLPGNPTLRRGRPFPVPNQDQPVKTSQGPQRKEVRRPDSLNQNCFDASGSPGSAAESRLWRGPARPGFHPHAALDLGWARC